MACVACADAFISAFGPKSLKSPEKRPIMRGVATIISVMEELNVRRLIQISTGAYRNHDDSFDFTSQAFSQS